MIESRLESNPPELAEAINAELDRLRIALAARNEECEKLKTDLRETADNWFNSVTALTSEGNRRIIEARRTANAELKQLAGKYAGENVRLREALEEICDGVGSYWHEPCAYQIAEIAQAALDAAPDAD